MRYKELVFWGLNPEFITPEFLASQGFSATLPWRFIQKVYKTESCWLWTAAPFQSGYGAIGRGSGGAGIDYSHRISWILHFGPIPDGLFVLHDCDRFYAAGDTAYRRCVNPDHLWLGTPDDNIQDMCVKRRHGRSAKLSPEVAANIRSIYASGHVTQYELADTFGVCQGTIGHVLHQRTWKHPV